MSTDVPLLLLSASTLPSDEPIVLRLFSYYTQTLARHSGVFPAWILNNDKIFYTNPRQDQSAIEIGCTFLLYFIGIFLCVSLADFLLARPLTYLLMNVYYKRKLQREEVQKKHFSSKEIKRQSWFLLHTLFNSLLILTSYHEAWLAICYPVTKSFGEGNWWGTCPGSLFGVVGVAAFHIHHLIFFTVTVEDIIHHVVNCVLVVAIGALTPWGRLISLSNFAMCGFPGGLNYFLLWIRKANLISQKLQKIINRFLNIVVRFPIQLLTQYAAFICVMHGTAPPLGWFAGLIMVIGSTLHTMNAIYYADQVVGNWHVFSTAHSFSPDGNEPQSPMSPSSPAITSSPTKRKNE